MESRSVRVELVELSVILLPRIAYSSALPLKGKRLKPTTRRGVTPSCKDGDDCRIEAEDVPSIEHTYRDRRHEDSHTSAYVRRYVPRKNHHGSSPVRNLQEVFIC